ncbi:MAG: bile acid:sodium symporter [Halioglobus sp.]|nr:bile acid:sodium symporter [Halioglobus sp.]
MVHELVNQYIGALIAIFLVTAMFSLGLDLTLRQIVGSLRDRRLVAVSLLANLAVVPLLALIITSLIPMDEGLRVGIVIYAFAAGTEGGPKFVQLIKGNTAFAFGLLVLLLIYTVTIVPLILPLVIDGAQIDTGAILIKLLLVVALPIGLGLLLNARYQRLANRLNPIVHGLAMFLLYFLVALLVYVNFQQLVSMQAGALLAGVLFFVLAFATGYLAGGPDARNRRALGIMTFGRNGSISMMIATEVFTDDPTVLVMATMMTATAVVVGVLIVNGMRRFT